MGHDYESEKKCLYHDTKDKINNKHNPASPLDHYTWTGSMQVNTLKFITCLRTKDIKLQ